MGTHRHDSPAVIAFHSFENTTIPAFRQGMIPPVCCGKPKRLASRREAENLSEWMAWQMDLPFIYPGWRSLIRRGWDSWKQPGREGVWIPCRKCPQRYVRHSRFIHVHIPACKCYVMQIRGHEVGLKVPDPTLPAHSPLIQKFGTSLITREGARFFFCLSIWGREAGAGGKP